jgi:hypothetical protein
MLKSIAVAALCVAITGSAALGQANAPANPEECLKTAFDIAQVAEGKKLPEDQLDKIEEMLTQMESHCDAKQFTEAAAVATDLKSMIEKQ